MGRPIKSVYFGNRNTDGVGGEGVLYANVAVAGEGYYDANVAVTFTAPQIAGGSTATGTATLNEDGNVAGVVITSAGTGYTSAPTMTITGANTTPASTFTITLTSAAVTNAIAANAWVEGDTVGRAVSDIVKQTGAKTFRVATSGGTGKCKLVTSDEPAEEGEMTITATFADGTSTFNVAKITDRVVYDADGNRYRWTLGTASNAATPVLVTITSL